MHIGLPTVALAVYCLFCKQYEKIVKRPPEGGFLIEGEHMNEALRQTENDEQHVSINDIYARFTHDRTPIVVEPSSNPKPIDHVHEQALAEARERIGHLTGCVVLRRTEIE